MRSAAQTRGQKSTVKTHITCPDDYTKYMSKMGMTKNDIEEVNDVLAIIYEACALRELKNRTIIKGRII